MGAFVAFDVGQLAAVSDFSKRVWESDRPHSGDFFRWRYIECPGQAGLVAPRDGRCVATLWWVQRDYRIGEQRAKLLEAFDWYVLPELLQSGLGIRVLRGLMARPEPILNVGGTAYTRGFLPRLGWRESTGVQNYRLESASKALASPFRASVEEVGRLNEEIMALYDGPLGYACVPVPSQGWHSWLTSGATGAGRFVTLQYRRADSVVGWAMGRVFRTRFGCEAKIVHIFTPHPEIQVYAWMVSALVQRLLAFAPLQIRASATCPVLGRALEQNGFLPGPKAPIFLWSNQPFELPEPLHLSGDIADKAVIPYDPGV